ncbi:hypothetical protein LAZ67_X004646 [Cordylochernes scorpioides]|uniref:Reverse transcriptase domain-containing protein n=1 Tax=Cordylochernes scorpioides TaxID=51811 RepID=A0ABY6LVF2_9ARAC|nr:hypothetical protein LAZ67_X004646 [Cordylochernes scorpioides]
MGSPLSSPLSEIVMRKIDKLITDHFPLDILTWFRYIDDIFSIIKIDSLDKIHTKLNSLYPDIQFTIEKESNSSLAFLDILITRQNCRYITNIQGRQVPLAAKHRRVLFKMAAVDVFAKNLRGSLRDLAERESPMAF